jgi:hypothetical protein
MEKGILNRLEWNLTVPTPYVFLVRFLKAASSDIKTDKEVKKLIFVVLSNERFCNSLCGLKFLWFNADGAHGRLLRRVVSNAVWYGDAHAFDGCCICCLCSQAHSEKDTPVDRHAQTPHRLQRVRANVRFHCRSLFLLIKCAILIA